MDGHVATLLQDALLRTRLAAATTPAESPEAEPPQVARRRHGTRA